MDINFISLHHSYSFSCYILHCILSVLPLSSCGSVCTVSRMVLVVLWPLRRDSASPSCAGGCGALWCPVLPSAHPASVQ